MNQADFIDNARLHIFTKYKTARRAAAAYGFAPSFLSLKLQGGSKMPQKLLSDMEMREIKQEETVTTGDKMSKTTTFTYEDL